MGDGRFPDDTPISYMMPQNPSKWYLNYQQLANEEPLFRVRTSDMRSPYPQL